MTPPENAVGGTNILNTVTRGSKVYIGDVYHALSCTGHRCSLGEIVENILIDLDRQRSDEEKLIRIEQNTNGEISA